MSYAGDSFKSVFTTLAADPSTEFGAPGARVAVIRSVDGPFSSVRRVSIQTPSRTTFAYVKIIKPRTHQDDELARANRMLSREYRATQELYSALRQDDEIGAVRPIACLPQHRALVTEEVPGRPLGELLEEASGSTDQLCLIASRVGKWVHAYQQIGAVPGAVEIAERRQYLDDRLALLEGRVLSASDRRATLARFDSMARDLGMASVPAVPIHADLGPMNLMVGDDGRVTALDFTMAKTGTIHHDLSHVYFHLELMAARHRHKDALVRALQSAMLRGYSPSLSARDPLFRMMLQQHAVCHVALLAERRVPVIDLAYRWFLRRRWQLCDQMAMLEPALRVA